MTASFHVVAAAPLFLTHESYDDQDELDARMVAHKEAQSPVDKGGP